MHLIQQPRAIASALVLISAVLLGVALYMEHVMGLEPCPLCMMQRIWVGIVGVLALGAALHNRGLHIYGAVTALAACIGAGFSTRQLWLQSLPADQVPACAPSLDYMLEVFPLTEVLQTMIMGSGDCAETVWTFLGLNIPGWMLVWFVIMATIAIAQTYFAGRLSREPSRP